ncbi:MAG: hypothetical protein KGJ59_13035, partial [Bacteroidota bacterium]|nr:hypothetical protein [Bacteroidota bacterium]
MAVAMDDGAASDAEQNFVGDVPAQDSGGRERTTLYAHARRVLARVMKHKALVVFSAIFIFCLVEYLSLPNESIVLLRSTNPSRTALMEQRLEEAKEQGKPLKIYHTWIPLAQISPDLVHAVIVSEDGTFYEN